MDGFAQALEDRFGAPVEAFDPFRKIAFAPKKRGAEDADADRLMATAAVAVGLALRRAGDR